MALVELLLPPLPAHVRTARLVGVAAARRAGLDGDLIDELRLAVGEACSRAVSLHAVHAPDTRVSVTVQDEPSRLVVTVRDVGPAASPVADDAGEVFGQRLHDGLDGDDGWGDPDVALAVVAGLVDDLAVHPAPDGTTVEMRWPLPVQLPGT
jgi:anti-sigma regulatory factor (Ser/Thr protein kinase)